MILLLDKEFCKNSFVVVVHFLKIKKSNGIISKLIHNFFLYDINKTVHLMTYVLSTLALTKCHLKTNTSSAMVYIDCTVKQPFKIKNQD